MTPPNLTSYIGELVDCPFCGSSDVILRYDEFGFACGATCCQCHCEAASLSVQPGTREAAKKLVVRKWNQRSGHEWRDLEKILVDSVTGWGKHFGVDTRCVNHERRHPIWQQIFGLLTQLYLQRNDQNEQEFSKL